MIPRPADAEAKPDAFRVRPPPISAPKGGGAIRGIGETFSANPVTGTGKFSIPIATTPGRSGFGPQLSLSYDSGSGNGTFGLGWSIGLPAIARKTANGLPRYNDEEDSDEFVLSGADDLVPTLARINGTWRREQPPPQIIGTSTYLIRGYRPRVEGLFARIERWTRQGGGDVFWRAISPSNVTTYFGRTPASRIADPDDPSHIFSWLISETHDDRGNVVVYDYQQEDSAQIDRTQAHERNREPRLGANRYIKRIRYGNTPSRLAAEYTNGVTWHFEVVFDYEEGHYSELPEDANGRVYAQAEAAPTTPQPWPVRRDAFSTYRAGFEVRTCRLCRRVLMFHRFPDELGVDACLVRSTALTYDEDPIATRLLSVSHAGYVRDPAHGYLKRLLPPVDLEYSPAPSTASLAAQSCVNVDAAALENLPRGLDGQQYQWLDLDGEALSGVLAIRENGWYYKPNLGGGTFGPVTQVASRPSLGGGQFMDLSGNGRLDVVVLDPPLTGFYERDDNGWEAFRAFASTPNVLWADPNLRFVDLTGDGRADLIVSENEAFVWHQSLADEGFGPAQRVVKVLDEEQGPTLVFADATQSVFLADMSGDGLADLVRIRNGEICYWPNLGYGRFGRKVTMDNAPWFDAPDQFDQGRLRLADIAGSGVTDIVYLHAQEATLYFNEAGNAWSAAIGLPQFPPCHDAASVQVLDFLGTGTACLLWSSPLATDGARQMRYLDLLNSTKPYLLTRVANNLGAETLVDYAPSTKFYVADKLTGTPWITRLPFPVHCVERVTVKDKWRGTTFSTTYTYHHGYFDGVEREFRGFGRVDQLDTEQYGRLEAGNIASPFITDDKTLWQPPIRTVTWFHLGMSADQGRVLASFEHEYFPHWFEALKPGVTRVLGDFREHSLPEPDLNSAAWSSEEWREALRACKGMLLRQEICELDVDQLEIGIERPVTLYSSAYHNCHIQMLQATGGNRHPVFVATESEAITYNYELDLRGNDVTPDPRISHTLNLKVDQHGHMLQSVAVVYPRAIPYADPGVPTDTLDLIQHVQSAIHIVYQETRYCNDLDDPNQHDDYRLGMPCEVTTYELTFFRPGSGVYFTIDDLRQYRLSDVHQTSGLAVKEWAYHETATGNEPGKRLVECVRTLFFNDDLSGPRDFGQEGPRGLPYESYKLALTGDLLAIVFSERLDANTPGLGTPRDALDDVGVSGYLSGATLANLFVDLDTTGQYWQRSGTAGFAAEAAQRFYLPSLYTDPFGRITTLKHDDKYFLYHQSSIDALGNTTTVTDVDFRVLAPTAITDANDNQTEVRYDALGMMVATALKGKGNDGDTLGRFDDDLLNPTGPELQSLFLAAYDEILPRRLLDEATSRFAYYFGEERIAGTLRWSAHPAAACGIIREDHVSTLVDPQSSRIQTTFDYTDGIGTVIVKKVQAEPEPGRPTLRWIANGKTVLNNKGNPVKQYEPYFSDVGHRFEEPAEVGVATVVYYDAPGRPIRTEWPDGTLGRSQFSPWDIATWDANDAVKESRWFQDRGSPNPATALAPDAAADTRAAWLAAQHANTPIQTFLDSLGRPVISIADLGVPDRNGLSKYVTFTRLDTESKPLWIRDPRGNVVMRYTLPQNPGSDPTIDFVTCYDLAGNALYQHSMDAGDRRMLSDAAGKPMIVWDVNERQTGTTSAALENRAFLTTYDPLHRPNAQWLSLDGGMPAMIERFEHSDTTNNPTIAADKLSNLVGQVRRHYDSSGLVELVRADFKGNLEEIHRQFTNKYDGLRVDWQTAVQDNLEPDTFVQTSQYDALSRLTLLYNWHQPTAGSRVAVAVRRYNERGLLVSESLDVAAARTAAGYRPSTHGPVAAITDLRYNAKGQKTFVELGNGTTTRYYYDPITFRLVQLRTARPGHDPTFPDYQSVLSDPTVLQQLIYTYDAIGNLTEVYDEAFSPVYFQNQNVEPRSQFRYDALYRLAWSSGRENGALRGAPRHVEDQIPLVQFPIAATNPNAMRRYTQAFEYDGAGNILKIQHAAGAGSWTRQFLPKADCNQLDTTWVGSNQLHAISYRYDTHGNLLNLAQTVPAQDVRWDYRDMIASLDLLGGGRAYYNYDSGKQRTRKRLQRLGGVIEDRRYFGGLELYRRYLNGAVLEEIESLHLLAGEQRLLLVDNVLLSDGTNPSREPLFRYQYSNHLGSACVELDQQAAIISYEEYHPYGTSAYQLSNASREAPPKRYRYTRMERDAESGLNYHSSRHYAPWLGSWVSCDPSGIDHGSNVYRFVSGNPVRLVDRTGNVGVETGEISPAVASLLTKKGIPFATEVKFDLLDEAGNVVVKGRFDYAFRDPRSGQLVLPEAKGIDLDSLTKNQLVYVKRFESGEGARIRITSLKGTPVGLPYGQEELITGSHYVRVGRGNIKDFASALEELTSGERIKYSFRESKGTTSYFKTEEEFASFVESKGMRFRVPSGFSRAALGLGIVAGAAEAGEIWSSAESQAFQKHAELQLADIQHTTLEIAGLKFANAELVGSFILNKSTGQLFALGDPDVEGPKRGMTLRQVDELLLINKGVVGNQGGRLVNLEYWLSETGLRIVHDPVSNRLTPLPAKEKGFFELLLNL